MYTRYECHNGNPNIRCLLQQIGFTVTMLLLFISGALSLRSLVFIVILF